MFGGLPYIKRPILNTFDANQTAPNTPTTPIAIDAHTCHQGGGAVDVKRISIAKLLTGGTKLIAVANVEFGFWEIGNQTQKGNVSTSINGIIKDCASRMSLTTAPTLTINEPYVRYDSTKKMPTYGMSQGFTSPKSANDTSSARPIPR